MKINVISGTVCSNFSNIMTIIVSVFYKFIIDVRGLLGVLKPKVTVCIIKICQT